MGNPLLVAQITDLHLFAEVDQQMFDCATADTFRSVIERLKQLEPQPDLLLLTGDLSQDETTASYKQLCNWLAPLRIPTYWLPGNHDNLPVMEQALNQPPVSSEKTFSVGGWQFILLNSLAPGCVYGKLSSASLTWLEQQLQLSTQPTLVSLHHPPCFIDSEWMDAIALKNPAEFLAIIDRYPQVKLVVFGHIHQVFDRQRQGVRYLGSPSTCVQFQPKTQEFAIDSIQPGFRFLALSPDGSYQTKIERVGSRKSAY